VPKSSNYLRKVRQRSFILRRTGYSPISSKCVCTQIGGLRKEIVSKAHHSPYTVHPRGTKMYSDVKGSYWWNNMKRDIAKFVQ
jgi:hypothetical protein